MEAQSVRAYRGLREALDKLTNEAAVLSEHTKRMEYYDETLQRLNASFDQVQSRLVRVASVKPAFSEILVRQDHHN